MCLWVHFHKVSGEEQMDIIFHSTKSNIVVKLMWFKTLLQFINNVLTKIQHQVAIINDSQIKTYIASDIHNLDFVRQQIFNTYSEKKKYLLKDSLVSAFFFLILNLTQWLAV